MKALLIAEKRTLMDKIKEVYNKMDFPDEITFTQAQGHLLSLKHPNEYNEAWSAWDKDLLPMFPSKFTYKTVNKRYLDIIKKELDSGKYDYVINAGDPEREGQLIVREILEHFNCKLPVKRIWHSDLTEKELKRALNNLEDDNNDKYSALLASAKLRSHFDWLVGMNLSRAATLSSGATVSVGRVMTPTLKIVVDRENEINNFVVRDFYEVIGDFEGGFLGKWFDEESNATRFPKKESAQKKIDKIKAAKKGKIKDVKKTRKKNNPNQLHDLAQLQIEANRAFGYSPTETLNIVQTLYQDRELLSYPRTDSRYITKNIASTIPAQLEILKAVDEFKPYLDMITKDADRMKKTLSNKRYVDDKKVTDHYAIIPTDRRPDMTKLTKDEANIYKMVVRRFVGMFLDPELIDQTTIITDVDGELFKTNGSVLVDKGYTVLYGNNNKKDSVLPNLSVNDEVGINGFEITTGKTTPPKRLTQADLVDIMDNINRKIEDDDLKLEKLSIGTSATSGSIIDKLIDKKMMKVEKKFVVPTEFGSEIISMLNDKSVASPEMTAIWEGKLRDIEALKLKPEVFKKEMFEFVEKETKDFLTIKTDLSKYNTKKPNTKGSGKPQDEIGKCPKCDSPMILTDKFLRCSKYKNGCDVIVSRKILSANLTKTDCKNLATGKKTAVKNVKYKSGKEGKVAFKFKGDGGLDFLFE